MFSKDTLEKTAIKLIAERGQLIDVLKEIVEASSVGFGVNSAYTAAALQRARKLLKEIDV